MYVFDGRLLSSVRHSFKPDVMARGEERFAAGCVTLRDRRANAYNATVATAGRAPFQVRIQIAPGDRLLVSCTCPTAYKSPRCEHVWATLLAACRDAAQTATVDAAPMAQERPSWAGVVDRVARAMAEARSEPPVRRELIYVLATAAARASGVVSLRLVERIARSGAARRLVPLVATAHELDTLVETEEERAALFAVLGTAALHARAPADAPTTTGLASPTLPASVDLATSAAAHILPMLARIGRLTYATHASNGAPLREEDLRRVVLDEGPAWRLTLRLEQATDGGARLSGALERSTPDGPETLPLDEPELLLAAGWLIADGKLARFDDAGAFQLAAELRRAPDVAAAPPGEARALVEALLGLPRLPPLEVPPELRYEEVAVVPQPVLRLEAPASRPWSAPAERLIARLAFRYGAIEARHGDPRERLVSSAERQVVRRDLAHERAALRRLEELGLRPAPAAGGTVGELASARLRHVVGPLIEEGWRVETDGQVWRRPSSFTLSVRSGGASSIDWFDVLAEVRFDDHAAAMPAVLSALRAGADHVVLADGSLGLVPADLAARLRRLDALAGEDAPDGLRFGSGQVALLDALLASEPIVDLDRTFADARERLAQFGGVHPLPPPVGFAGELRPYQQHGLGWLASLRALGFGGCLADDMGLGKTVQVVALLLGRTREREQTRKGGSSSAMGHPSLVVVPKSLLTNWQREIARFAPSLTVLVHSGPGRIKTAEALTSADVVLTSYGLLKNDLELFQKVRFDYAILDEAQAIKNAGSVTAKAARLLRANHRLALSGTPVENHLGELWSLFEFLNPGLLGSLTGFERALAGAAPGTGETRELVARAVRPFVLRRTKEEVAPELPSKHEEVLVCDLEGKQARLYDELRRHFRASVLGQVDRDGLGRSKMVVLEALLRLRQAACHPGLVDPARAKDASAKLDALVPRLAELAERGHKALVFSQFTSFLDLLEPRLAAEGVSFERLDGKTKDRAERVDRFQNDPSVPCFLLSLKAGGVGLNLTAADYVFLLDPWWNPAVEAQAVDRTHRIGQKNRVFVYRLVCRDTVEDKILELQKSKRELVAALWGDRAGSVLGQLDRDTLERLLS